MTPGRTLQRKAWMALLGQATLLALSACGSGVAGDAGSRPPETPPAAPGAGLPTIVRGTGGDGAAPGGTTFVTIASDNHGNAAQSGSRACSTSTAGQAFQTFSPLEHR